MQGGNSGISALYIWYRYGIRAVHVPAFARRLVRVSVDCRVTSAEAARLALAQLAVRLAYSLVAKAFAGLMRTGAEVSYEMELRLAMRWS